MTVRKVTPLTEITPGQWICETPLLRDHICSPPREVVRRSGSRVYRRNRHGEDEGAYCAVKSIVALCDTKEEADAFFAVSSEQAYRLNAVRAEQAAKAEALFK
jgi:hypothetical protein